MACTFDLHPMRASADKRLRDGVFPKRVAEWVTLQTPGQPISRVVLLRHRRKCLQLPAMRPATGASRHPKAVPSQAIEPPEAPAAPAAPPRSAGLGRAVTQEDIEQALLTKFFDSIDAMSPDRIAEVMIERAKAEQKRAPAKDKEPTEDDPRRALARKIGLAVGARPSRTSSRVKRAS